MATLRSRILALSLGVALAGGGFAIAYSKIRESREPNIDLDATRRLNAATAGSTYKPDGIPLPFALKPNYSDPPRLVTNSLGMRSSELAEKKSVPRVLVLGDSMVYGYGLNEGEPFCQLAAAKLRGKAEIANASLSGYQIQELVAQYERHADKVDPDVVFIAFMVNDLDDSHTMTPGGQAGFPTLAELPEDGTFGAGSNLTRMAQISGMGKAELDAFIDRFKPTDEFFFRGIGPFARARLERYERDLARIVKPAKARGAAVVLMSFYGPQRGLLRACANLGVPFFDMGDLNLGEKKYQLPGNPHPNAWANTLIANRFLSILAATHRIEMPAGVTPAKPFESRPAFEAKLDAERLEYARRNLRPNVILHPTEARLNLHQVVAGFEDANGKLGARAVVLLQGGAKPKRVKIVLGAVLPPGEEKRTLEVRLTGGPPIPVELHGGVQDVVLDLPESAVEALDPKGETYLVEVDIRDLAVLAVPPAERAGKVAVRIHRIGLESGG